MLGNEGIARGAWEAGVTVATAYPGTPSTEINEAIATYDDIYSEWAPNEKVALEVGIGASIGGARTLVSMKHVGVNVAADPLFTAAYTGVNGGLVIAVADDPGMHSSQNEQDSRYYAKAAHIPMLEPSDSQEAKDFVGIGLDLSEEYDTPVFIRLTTRISHSQGVVELCERAQIPLKPYTKDYAKYTMMPSCARKRHVFVEEREIRLAEDANNLPINKIEMADTKIGIITSGMVYQHAKEALPDASYLKLGMVYPLPKTLIEEFASKVDKLIVLEELDPIIEEQLKVWGIEVVGKELFSIQGEYSANEIAAKLGGNAALVDKPVSLPMRPPVLCPGCSHRGFYYIVKKLKLHVTGDIGCYTLGALPPLETMDTCVCMGASIGMAMGMEKARGRDFAKKLIAVIGDSTFFHSGITGLIDMVYNKGMSTVVIMDNSTTGMTGHQDHPGTGCSIKGDIAPMVDIEALVRSLGVKNLRVVDPFDLKDVEKVLREETAKDEISVIISRRECALKIKFYETKRIIDSEKCNRCGMCLRLGCPAIEKKPDGLIVINSALCVGCGLCQDVCKFDAISKVDE